MGQEKRSAKAGRPRDPGVSQAIEDAVLRILENDGYQALSILGVAKLSGVSSTAIYRRFLGKEHLVVHVIAKLYEKLELQKTGDLRNDLVHAFLTIRRAAVNPVIYNTLPPLLVAVGEDSEMGKTLMDAVILPRRNFAMELVRQAVERGELRRGIDAEMLIDTVAGYILYRTWTLRATVTEDQVRQLVDLSLHGAEAEPAAPR